MQMRMCHILICGPSHFTTFPPHCLINGTIFGGGMRYLNQNSFIFHSVNPWKVPNNLKDIELVILLIIYT